MKYEEGRKRHEVAETVPRCSGTRKDGSPCQGFPFRGDPEGLCSTHSPLVEQRNRLIAGEAKELAALSTAARRAKREAREREKLAANATVRDALRAEAAKRRDAVVAALFAPLDDDSLDPREQQQAAIRILERILGRPGEVLDSLDGDVSGPIDWAEVAELWSEQGE